MTPQSEFLQLLVETAEKSCDLGCEISLLELPKEGGIYAELGQGFLWDSIMTGGLYVPGLFYFCAGMQISKDAWISWGQSVIISSH